MSRYLEIPLFEIVYDADSRLVRYVKSIFQTIKLILSNKPNFVFAQNPSIVLAALSVLLGRFLGFKTIIDAHNSGVYPLEGKSLFFKKINQFIVSRSYKTIVTNENLARDIRRMGGDPVIIPDPLPRYDDTAVITNKKKSDSQKKIRVLCITSWATDEPIDALIRATSGFSEEIEFSFTSDFKKYDEGLETSKPKNVVLLGYISNEEYIDKLFGCDFTIDLTTRDDCMVCGAYESVSAEKPMLLSENSALKSYFSSGAAFCDNTETGISESIRELINNLADYRIGVANLRQNILEYEKRTKTSVLANLGLDHKS